MNELLFNGMDIVVEVNKLLNPITKSTYNDLTGSQELAYDMGVKNTLNALKALLELDEEPVVHISGLNEIEEMSVEELENIFVK